MEGGHSPPVVRRVPADVLDREVDGERRRPIRRQPNPRVEKARYLGLSAAWNASCDSEKRGIVTRISPSPTASSALGSSGRCSPPVGSGRRAEVQCAASRSGPVELVVGDEAVAHVERRGRRSARFRGAIGRASLRRGGRRVGGLEAFSPGRVARVPPELPLGLGVRRAARLGAHHDGRLAGDQAREPARQAPRRLGAQRLREHRQPLAHRRGLVVDDVEDARPVVLEREHGRRRGVVEMDPRRDAPAVADDRVLPLAHRLDQPVVGGAVEDPVAERDPAGVGDRLLEMAHRGARLARRRDRGGIEGVVLGLDQTALARGPEAGEALRDEPADARLARGREQRVGALGPQPVRLRERAVEVAREGQVRQGRRLVDDRVRRGLEHGPAHGRAIEQIERDRLGAERPEVLRLLGRPRGADHLVASLDELGDQPGADRTARSCNEYSHWVAPSVTSPRVGRGLWP